MTFDETAEAATTGQAILNPIPATFLTLTDSMCEGFIQEFRTLICADLH